MTNFGFDRALYGFEREGFSVIRDAYKARCVNLGRHVTFDGGEGTPWMWTKRAAWWCRGLRAAPMCLPAK